MKHIKIILCLFMSLCLFSCSDKPSSDSSINSSENQQSGQKNNTILANTKKLNFDDTIINIPEAPKVYQLTFDRKKWTKSELTKGFIECTNNYISYLDDGLSELSENDLNFRYLDFIKGNKGEEIERNFYQLSANRTDITAFYQHYACFYRIESAGADIDSTNNNSYFNDNSDSLFETADKIIDEITLDYDDFFSTDGFDMIPYAYNKGETGQYFQFGVTYNDVLLDTDYYGSLDSSVLSVHKAQNIAEAITDNNGELVYMTSYYNWDVTEDKAYDNILPIEDACKIFEDEISDYVSFDVSRIDLIYRIDENLDDDDQVLSWSGTPCYKFTVDATGIAEYPRLAFFVDVVTGDFSSFPIVR